MNNIRVPMQNIIHNGVEGALGHEMQKTGH
jgi:hypothetical protein